MEYLKDQMLALFQRRMQIELDVNTQVNVRLLDSVSPPRRWEILGFCVCLEWIGGRHGWVVGEWRSGKKFAFLYRGSDYAAAVAVFEAALLSA